MQAGDHKLLKSINERLVLNLIRLSKVISSSDLVQVTGMQPSTIFNILRALTSKLASVKSREGRLDRARREEALPLGVE